MDEFEKELKQAFFLEADQLLSDAEQAFLQLEAFNGDLTIIHEIFRLIHSIKGSARAAGFDEMSAFSHQFESLLAKLKKGELKVTSGMVTLLLKCNDHLRGMVTALKQDLGARIDSSDYLAEIQNAIDGNLEEQETPQAAESREASAAEPMQENTALEEETAAEPTYWGPRLVSSQESVPTREPQVQIQVQVQAQPVASVPTQAAAPKTEKKPEKHGETQEESIRLSLKRLEILMNRIGELVILQTVLNQQKHTVESLMVQKTITQLAKITKNIQGISMSLKMIPLKQAFQKLQRTSRDTSKSLKKEVEFSSFGDETEMDKSVIDSITEPLNALVRYVIEESLETPEDREQAGKGRTGQLVVNALLKGNRIMIEVTDDGCGAIPNGSGESRLQSVTQRIAQLQGDLKVIPTPGMGTSYQISMPLTLAIIDAMIVRVDQEHYVFPLDNIYESIRPTTNDVSHVSGLGEVITVRGESMPLFRLADVLKRKRASDNPSDGIACLVRSSGMPFAVLVDDIVRQQQVVIKPFGEELSHLKGFRGSAILGDGKASLIMDINELVRGSARTSPKALRPAAA